MAMNAREVASLERGEKVASCQFRANTPSLRATTYRRLCHDSQLWTLRGEGI